MTLHDRFEQFNDEFLKFDRVQAPRSARRDLHAFLVLEEIMPGKRPMIAASEHDEFYLDINCDEFNAKATDDQIMELLRCGVRHDQGFDSLCMFA